MAGLLASVAVKLGLDKLSSFLPASLTSPPTASSSSSLAAQDDLEDLRSLERTMRRIRATLEDAEEHWNIREESAKLRLEELKEVAYDAEDVVDEYEYEVKRCKLEALEPSAGVQSSNNKRKRHQGANGGGWSQGRRRYHLGSGSERDLGENLQPGSRRGRKKNGVEASVGSAAFSGYYYCYCCTTAKLRDVVA